MSNFIKIQDFRINFDRVFKYNIGMDTRGNKCLDIATDNGFMQIIFVTEEQAQDELERLDKILLIKEKQ